MLRRDSATAPPTEARAPEGVAALIAMPQFRWLTTSNVAFFLAMGSQMIVRPSLAYGLTQDEFLLGLVGFAMAVPMLLAGPFGGVAADRFDRRRLILIAQFVALAGEAITLTLLWLGQLRFWHLMATAVVMGAVFPFLMPARQAVVANLVGRAQLGAAIGFTTTLINITRVVGPAIPGFIEEHLDVRWAYTFSVALYAFAFVCALKLAPARPALSPQRASVSERVMEGVRYVRQDRAILVLLAFGLVPMFLAMPFQNLLVVFAEKVWHVGTPGLSQLSVSMGLGGILGSVLVSRRPHASERAQRMLLAMLGFGALLIAFCLSPWFALAIPLLFVANTCASWFQTTNNTAIQLLIPDDMRGRVSSFLMMSFSLPMLGSSVIGLAARCWGASLAVSVFAALAMAASVAFYYGSEALRGLDARMSESQ
jgi:MFS family permease